MKRIFLTLVISWAAMAAGDNARPKDVEGYSKTRWGMTDDEILAALPGQAVRLTAPLPKRSYAGGIIANIGIEDLEIAHTKYTLHFVPGKDGKLFRVRIAPVNRGYAIHFQALEAILTEKYGPPSYKSVAGNHMVAKWNFPSTTIDLDYTDYGALLNMSVLVVMYEKHALSDLDKM
jgi:hypothetical protein